MTRRIGSLAAVVGVLSAVALPAGEARAAVPGTLTEQGRLFDATGAPLTGTVSIAFTLYDAATGGTALWTVSPPREA